MQFEAAFDDADLNGYVDGRIDASRAAALSASLLSDPETRARLDAWRRQNDGLRAMFASVAFEPVPLRLLPAPIPGRAAAAAGGRPGRRTAGAVATTACGALLFGFALGALASHATDGFGLEPARVAAARADDLAARAVEAHRAFIAEAVQAGRAAGVDEVGAHRSRVGGAPRAPDLARQGWTMLGAHAVPGRRGPSTFVVYGSGPDRLGLLVAPGAEGEGRAAASDDGAAPLGVAAFDEGDTGYAFTSDRGPEWLSRNLARLRDSVRAQARAGD